MWMVGGVWRARQFQMIWIQGKELCRRTVANTSPFCYSLQSTRLPSPPRQSSIQLLYLQWLVQNTPYRVVVCTLSLYSVRPSWRRFFCEGINQQSESNLLRTIKTLFFSEALECTESISRLHFLFTQTTPLQVSRPSWRSISQVSGSYRQIELS